MRSYQFGRYFNEKFEIIYCPLFTEAYLAKKYKGKGTSWEAVKSYLGRIKVLFSLPSAELIWMEKEAFPFLPSVFEKIVRFLSKKLIVDYDDAIFHNYDDHSSGLVRKLLGKKIDNVMASADLIIAGNNYISLRAIAAGARRVVIAPTVIPESLYPEIKNQVKNDPPIIGWIGTPMTQKFLLEIESVLDELHNEVPFQLNLIGISEEFWIHKIYRNRVAWNETTESSELAKIDIGIMPLTNNKFEQGKCGFKLIQYMGCSKSVLASPIGVNTSIVNHGVNGFLCSAKEEWLENLKNLLQNPDLRERLGQNGRRDYVEKFTQEAWGPKLTKFAEEVLRE